MVERWHTDDLMPNVPIFCISPSRVDPEVQRLKVIIDCLQPGSSRATFRPHPVHSAGGLSAAATTRWWASSRVPWVYYSYLFRFTLIYVNYILHVNSQLSICLVSLNRGPHFQKFFWKIWGRFSPIRKVLGKKVNSENILGNILRKNRKIFRKALYLTCWEWEQRPEFG